jgi:hypothetical protein
MTNTRPRGLRIWYRIPQVYNCDRELPEPAVAARYVTLTYHDLVLSQNIGQVLEGLKDCANTLLNSQQKLNI